MARNVYPLSYVSSSLNKIISEFLTEYSEELQAKADKITEQVAKDFASQLKDVTLLRSISPTLLSLRQKHSVCTEELPKSDMFTSENGRYLIFWSSVGQQGTVKR